MEIAHATGTLEPHLEAPTLRVFVEETFKPLHLTKFRQGGVAALRGAAAARKDCSTSLATSTSMRSARQSWWRQPGSSARAGRPLQAPHHATLRARHRRGSSRRDRAASG